MGWQTAFEELENIKISLPDMPYMAYLEARSCYDEFLALVEARLIAKSKYPDDADALRQASLLRDCPGCDRDVVRAARVRLVRILSEYSLFGQGSRASCG